MENGDGCAGTKVGSVGREVGVGRDLRGDSRSGSTDLRYDVNTSGRELGLSKGMSRLGES